MDEFFRKAKLHHMSLIALGCMSLQLLLAIVTLAQINGDDSAACADGVHVVASFLVAISVILLAAFALGSFLVWRRQRNAEITHPVGMGSDE